MISFKTKKPELAFTLSGGGKVTLTAPRQKLELLDKLDDKKDYVVEIKEHREKRSLNANAYAWLLIGKIAEKIKSTADEVYLIMLKRYGVSEMISVYSEIDMSHYLKYYEEAGKSVLNGKNFTHYKVYKGSSEFDTNEMSRLIDGIIDEAKELGIDTRTPEQIAEMTSLWKTEKV